MRAVCARRAAGRPFNGQLGDISAAEYEATREAFLRAETDVFVRQRGNWFVAGAGGPGNRERFVFVATGGATPGPDPESAQRGMQMIVSSTTYAHDRLTNSYATIRATPERPIEILEIDGELFIGSYRYR
jgi:hypothetical protein